jgi:hypothetical protein
VSINIIVAIAGICLIDLCYIFVIHSQQDATQRNKRTASGAPQEGVNLS